MEGRRSSFKCCRHPPIYRNGDPCYGDATRNGLTNGDGDINGNCVFDSNFNGHRDCHLDSRTKCNSADGILRGVCTLL